MVDFDRTDLSVVSAALRRYPNFLAGWLSATPDVEQLLADRLGVSGNVVQALLACGAPRSQHFADDVMSVAREIGVDATALAAALREARKPDESPSPAQQDSESMSGEDALGDGSNTLEIHQPFSSFRDNPTTPSVVIEVHSRPVTQGSKKAFNHHHTGRAMLKEQMDERLRNWRADVRAAAEPHRGCFAPKEPLRVIAHFTLPKPAGAPKRRRTWPTGMRNDLEKLLRSTYDALTSSGVGHDDSQVVQEMSSKSYPNEGDGPSCPGVLLLIYSLLSAADQKVLRK